MTIGDVAGSIAVLYLAGLSQIAIKKGRQIANHDCRVYQRGFACRDVHLDVNLRNQDILRCTEYAVKTRACGCDDTCAAEN